MILVAVVKTRRDTSIILGGREAMMEKAISLMVPLYEALEKSQYQVDKLLGFLRHYSSNQESE
jgi:hypothetical protein